MDFQKQYRSMNEQIAPDGALVSDTLARIARGDKPYRRPRRLRRVVTLAVAAAVAIGCVTPRSRRMYRACIRRCTSSRPRLRRR